MGRYTTRFEAGGSTNVGAIYTAAAGGGNSKFAVLANGQTLLRTDYPGLANYYSGQTEFDTLRINGTLSGAVTTGDTLYTPYDDARGVSRGSQVAAKFSGFRLYMQPVIRETTTGAVQRMRVWYTQDEGDSWKLTDFEGDFGSDAGFITTSSAVYILHGSGLHRTTDGLNYTQIYTTGVRGLTELNGIAIFTTKSGTSGIITTAVNDFNNFTGYIASGINPFAIVNYSGTLYAFGGGQTGVRFSTNTGQTWQVPASGKGISNGGYYAEVINGYLVVPGYSATGPIYVYSTNPTGTTNTWTQISGFFRTNAGTAITNFEYDTVADRLLVGCQHYFLGDGEDYFGYIVSGVTGTVTPCTGARASVVFSTGLFPGGYSYPFFIASGSKRVCYNDWLFKVEFTGVWDNLENIDLNNTANRPGYGMTPFIPAGRFKQYGWAALGTTNSGNRYIIKCNSYDSGNTDAFTNVTAIYVEQSGYFKPLTTKSGSTVFSRANYGAATGVAASLQAGQNNMIVAEASGKYIVAWQNTGITTTINYNRYSIAERTGTTDFALIANSPYVTRNQIIAGSTKSDGIYFIDGNQLQNENTFTGVRIAASGSPTVFNVTASGLVSTLWATPGIQFSDISNEVILSYTTSGSVTGVIIVIDKGAVTTRSTYFRYDATGGLYATQAGSYVVKSQGVYYVFDTSSADNLAKSTTPLERSRVNFQVIGVTNRIPTGLTGYAVVLREVAQSEIVGVLNIENKAGAVVLNQVRVGNAANSYNMNRIPNLFKTTGNTYLLDVAGGSVTLETVTSGTGYFTVPNMTSSVTGEAKYIIAR